MNGDIGGGGWTGTETWRLIFGINTTPIAQADTGSVNEDATLTVVAANGVILSGGVPAGVDSDVDGGDRLSVIGVKTGTAGSVAGVGVANVGSSLAGTYGHLTVAANGGYSYVADVPAADALNLGQSVSDVFSYAISDGKSGMAFAILTITVHGLDDALTVNNSVVNEASPYAVFTVGGAPGMAPRLSRI